MGGFLDQQSQFYGRLNNTGTTPTLTTTGIGTGGTSSIVGGPVAGMITITAGLLPVTGGFARVTFAIPLAVAPSAVHFTVATSAALGVGYITADQNGFTITGLLVALATYSYYYTVIV